MNFRALSLIALSSLALVSAAHARDTELKLPLADVLSMPEAQGKLDGSVQFFLSGQKTPKVLQKLGEGVANKKTNGFNKSDEDGCRWAALSALIALQDSAKQRGANAVIDVVSFYKRETDASPTDYECHAGAFVTGVTLKGTYAKISAK